MGKVMIVCYRSERGRTNRDPKARCPEHSGISVSTLEELNATVHAIREDEEKRPGLIKQLLRRLAGETGEHWLEYCDENGEPLPCTKGPAGSIRAAWEFFHPRTRKVPRRIPGIPG